MEQRRDAPDEPDAVHRREHPTGRRGGDKPAPDQQTGDDHGEHHLRAVKQHVLRPGQVGDEQQVRRHGPVERDAHRHEDERNHIHGAGHHPLGARPQPPLREGQQEMQEIR